MKHRLLFIFIYLLITSSDLLFAQLYKWPIADTNAIHRIWTGYGQIERLSATDFYFHEGLDLITPNATPVIAICDGVIVQKNISSAVPSDRFLELGITVPNQNIKTAFLYLHIDFGNNPNANRPWIIGDVIHQGDVLGYVLTYSGVLPHLHFEYDTCSNPVSWLADSTHTPRIDSLADIKENPINVLTPRTDNIKPTIDTTIYFRDPFDEGSQTAAYFEQRTSSGKKVIKNGVDMIVQASDTFGSFPMNNAINVMKIEHKVKALKGTSGYDYQTLIDFSGGFLAHDTPDSGRNTYQKFRQDGCSQVNVIYEDDNTLPTITTLPTANTGIRRSYYILTNIDTSNYSLQSTDADYFWNTKSKADHGIRWNDPRENNITLAVNNETAQFPDGLYNVSVRAAGYGGDEDTSRLDYTILINNFDENIYSCSSTGAARDTFCMGESVYIKGEGFPREQSFRVFIMKDTVWTDNKYFAGDSSRIGAITVSSDTDGIIQPTMIWNDYQPNGFPDLGYAIVLDFDDDSLYTSKRENFTVDAKDTSIADHKSIIGRKNIEKEINYETCSGNLLCNASVTYNIPGGRPPYNIYSDFLLQGQDSVVFLDSLCPGMHIITIIDSACVINDTLNIDQVLPLDIHCFQSYFPPCGQQGNIGVAAGTLGGLPPFHYFWNTGDTTPFVNNLPNGTYTITITDSTGCADTCSLTAVSPDSLRTTPDVIPVNCINNGEIHLNLTGGSGNYTITWEYPDQYTFQTGPYDYLVNLFDTGNYIAYIFDNYSCYLTDTIHLTGNPKYEPYGISGYINCSPDGGQIDYEIIGAGSFTYSWSGPNGFTASTQDLDSLTIPGDYIINVNDGNGCSWTDTINMPGRPPVYMTSVMTPMNCDSLGSIDITPSGGTPPFMFNWSTTWGYVSHLEDIHNLIVSGNYFVSITDAAGCTVNDTILLTGSQRVRIFGLTTPVNCGSNGAITVFPLSGTPPFSYSWMGPDSFISANQNLAGLSKTGLYIVTTTDQNGCMHKDSFNLAGNSPVAVSASLIPIYCGTDGEIHITPTGGTTPYSFLWSGPGGFNSANQDLISLTLPGNYTVTVTSTNGCSATLSNTLGGSTQPVCSAVSVPINCNSPGSITSQISGGAAASSYFWTGPNNFSLHAQNLFNLPDPGNYHLIYTDVNGCFCETDVMLTGSPAITGCALTFSPLSCVMPGAVNSNVTGGTGPFSYVWNGPSGYFSTSANISGLTVLGNYSMTVTDANGCTCSSSGVLVGAQPLACTASSTPIACNGTGSVGVSTSGGTAPFQYHWTGPAGFSSNLQNVTGLITPGNYTVLVQDANNCSCNKVIAVTSLGNLGCSISINNITCHGLGNGTLTVIPSGGLSPYQYLWNNSGATPSISGLLPGNYSVTVTDANGCSGNAAAVLFDPPALTVSINGSDSLCNNDTLLLSSSAAGGTGSIVYSWTGPAGFSSSFQNISIFNISTINAGIYSLNVTDSNGCNISLDDTVYIQLCDSGISLNAKVFIEGYYLGSGSMIAAIDPVNYPNTSDTIVLQLASPFSPYSILYLDTAILQTDGTAHFQFNGAAPGNYYLVLRHRNSMQSWSSSPVYINSVTSYDFTNAINKVYGNNLRNLGDGNFAIWSGDISDANLGVGYQDGVVESQDYSDMENAVYLTLVGYLPEDITGDGVVESADYSLMENNVFYIIVMVRP